MFCPTLSSFAMFARNAASVIAKTSVMPVAPSHRDHAERFETDVRADFLHRQDLQVRQSPYREILQSLAQLGATEQHRHDVRRHHLLHAAGETLQHLVGKSRLERSRLR